MSGGIVLVTGATGFVGAALLERLLADGHFFVRAAVRHGASDLPVGVERVVVGNLTPDKVWQQALTDVEVVVHLAARVHVMHDTVVDPQGEFRRVNVAETLAVARQAAAVGVRRFIYLSSIKVNGEETLFGRPFTDEDQPAPQDAYAVSKWEAEQGLRKLADRTGMEVVIIRPTLVYGPRVKANFFTMMCWLYKGIPLPLGLICNKRSLMALDNLVDLIVVCIDCLGAANQTFLVADGEDLSTSELLRRMGDALNVPARLLPVPKKLLEIGFKVTGKSNLASRLCGSLQVDITKACTVLNWSPPISVDEGLRRTAEHFLRSRSWSR